MQDATKTVELKIASDKGLVALLEIASYAGSGAYRDGILLWTLADGAMTLAEALRDDPNDPYVRGGVVYLVVRAIAPGQTLREILCSYAPEKQWLEDLPAGVPECEAPSNQACSIWWTDGCAMVLSVVIRISDGAVAYVEYSYYEGVEAVPWSLAQGEPKKLFDMISSINEIKVASCLSLPRPTKLLHPRDAIGCDNVDIAPMKMAFVPLLRRE